MPIFFVPGIPQPGGSKRGFIIRRKSGKQGIAMADTNPKAKSWRQDVAFAAAEHFPKPIEGPIEFSFEFQMLRPNGHSGKKGLRAGAPAFPTTRPDCTKLTRSTEDALKGIAWGDDSQVVTQTVTKRYAERPGCIIRIEAVDQ